MAINFEYPLTNSEGMEKVISFEGLEFPIVISPTLLGEPLLTAQAFYYLNKLESVAKIRFEKKEDIPSHNSKIELERRIEYIIDNYLFAYSKKHPFEHITSKITNFKYWKNDGYTQIGYDNNNTKALALDVLNDDSIIEISSEDKPSKEDWNDWCLVSNYTSEYLENYIDNMKSLLDKKVDIETDNHEELGTSKKTLPLITVDKSILNYHQALMLDVISTDNLRKKDNLVIISRGMESSNNFTLPLETFNVDKYYDAELLSYYFAGIREHLPISKFRSFYNVVEYFFEEAPSKIGVKAKYEREQLKCVIKWIIGEKSLLDIIQSMKDLDLSNIQRNMETSSGTRIKGLNLISNKEIEESLATWIYEIRCAIIHSKKTRKGKVESRFVPYSFDEEIVSVSIPILQKLAVMCIEKESE